MTTASDLVALNVKRFRKHRNWTAPDLAAACAELGAPELSAAVLANIETGRRDAGGQRRRDVAVEEWLVLAAALNVSPADLLLSREGADRFEPVPVDLTPSLTVTVSEVGRWLRGLAPVPTSNDRDDFLRHAEPSHRLELQIARHPAWQATDGLRTHLAPAIDTQDDVEAGTLAKLLRRALGKVTRRVEDLIEELEERADDGADRG